MNRRQQIGGWLAGVVLIAMPLWAGTQTYTKSVRRTMGENESRQAVREAALLEAKRQALEEAGVLVMAETTLKDVSKQTGRTIEDSSEFNQSAQALAAGVTKTEIVSEEWKSEGGGIVFSLTCRVSLDPEDMNRQIRRLAEERAQQPDLSPLQDEMAKMKKELEDLRKQAERSSTPITVQNVTLPGATPTTETVVSPDPALAEARGLFERGLYDEATASLKNYLNQKGPSAPAHLLLGQVYAQKKAWYDLAVREMEKAEKLAPSSPEVKIALAIVHLRAGKKPERGIPLLEKALKLQPDNPQGAALLEEARKLADQRQNTFE